MLNWLRQLLRSPESNGRIRLNLGERVAASPSGAMPNNVDGEWPAAATVNANQLNGGPMYDSAYLPAAIASQVNAEAGRTNIVSDRPETTPSLEAGPHDPLQLPQINDSGGGDVYIAQYFAHSGDSLALNEFTRLN